MVVAKILHTSFFYFANTSCFYYFVSLCDDPLVGEVDLFFRFGEQVK